MPASWRTSDLTVLAVAGAATVLLTAASFVAAPPSSLPRDDGSSYAAHADGGRAAFLLLQRLGYTIERSFEPLSSLSRRQAATTAVVIASPSQPPSDRDAKALVAFVESGGLVLATGPEAASFLPGGLRRAARSSRASVRQASLPSPFSAGVTDVEMPAADTALPLHSPFVPVFGTVDEPAVVAARLGLGTAVWWAGSGPLVNGGIERPGHVELLVNTLGPAGERTILWDEFYHGHSRSIWSYLRATPLPAAILQVALIGAVALFTFSRRRRPIRSLVTEPRTSPLEFIDTMGGLYERARAAHAAIGTIRERTRRRLLEATGLPASTPDERLVTAAADRLAIGSEVSAALARAREAAADPALTPSQAVAVAADLQALAARAQAAQRQRQRRV
jgi:Domain of unknown function (DUF4350)